MRRWLFGSAVLVAVCSLSAWLFWPAPRPSPSPLVAERGEPIAAGPRGRMRRERPRTEAVRPHKRRPVEKEPVLASSERVRVRSDFREERMIALDEQLDAYAEEAGWDPVLVEDVRSTLIETLDHIGTELARVDAGEEEWEVLKPELRQYRIEQAAALEGLLGDDFDPFTEAMAFGRFLGERPPGRERFEPFLQE